LLQKVFLSDFDGTITEKDVLVSIMEHFAPQEWKEIYKELLSGKIGIDEGIKRMFNLIPSIKKDEIIDWVLENAKIRDGFEEFLDYLNTKEIPFVILSGGLDFYISQILKPYLPKIHKIYANKALFDKEFIDVQFIYKCGDYCNKSCGVCKPYIIHRDFKNFYRYYAGDGITDILASKHCHFIFATSNLKLYLRKENIDFVPFETFYDILRVLSKKQ